MPRGRTIPGRWAPGRAFNLKTVSITGPLRPRGVPTGCKNFRRCSAVLQAPIAAEGVPRVRCDIAEVLIFRRFRTYRRLWLWLVRRLWLM